MVTKNKTPKIKQDFKAQKTGCSVAVNVSSDDSGSILWSFSRIDKGGSWGFDSICKARLHELVFSEFGSKEGISWALLKQSKSHNVAKESLVKDARARLAELKLDDLEELFSLRFSGKERLWGIRDGNVLRVLWWDPEHEVCPSQKKNT